MRFPKFLRQACLIDFLIIIAIFSIIAAIALPQVEKYRKAESRVESK